jgi:glycosyltransferase involved in cell wall biosynthesis
MAERKKILWLVSWYPNKYDRFDGDFIQRHAGAAALYHDVHVIFVKASEEQNEIEEQLYETESLTEQIIYIPKQKGITGKLKNYNAWKKTYKTAVDNYIQQSNPSLVHVHIPWKVGLIGLWIKRKYEIPFIVTEHWGIYNNIVDDNIHTKSFPVRHLLKRIYKEATAFASVSSYLGEGVNQTLLKKEYSVIPNVVETSLFYPKREKHPRFTFLHVSNMVPLKNVEGILQAFQQFLETGVDAQLILIGNKDSRYKQLAKQLELLDTNFFFRGEIPYADVAKEMQRSHVLVLNSNIENSPCVIGEALCCGVPVIATNVGGIPELIKKTEGFCCTDRNCT